MVLLSRGRWNFVFRETRRGTSLSPPDRGRLKLFEYAGVRRGGVDSVVGFDVRNGDGRDLD